MNYCIMNSSGMVTSDAPIYSHGIQEKCNYIDCALLSHHIDTVACLFSWKQRHRESYRITSSSFQQHLCKDILVNNMLFIHVKLTRFEIPDYIINTLQCLHMKSEAKSCIEAQYTIFFRRTSWPCQPMVK